MHEIAEENVQVLTQLMGLIGCISAADYQQHAGLHRQQTIGKHVRHIIDHYEAFLRCSRASSPMLVSYEHRQREELVETVPAVASDRMRRLCEHLQQFTGSDLHNAVQVEYPTVRRTSTLNSSVGRELTFLASHTIHHMAIIGLLAEQLGLQPDPGFGVHPSTQRHWEEQESLEAAI